MPRKYVRKPGVVPRQLRWTETNLALAFKELKKKQKGVNEIARMYGIPRRTLQRRFVTNNFHQIFQGKYPVLGLKNEKHFVAHILRLKEEGFPLGRKAIRQLAYQFAEKLHLKHNFNNETKMAGFQWLQNFFERNPEIAMKRGQGLSLEKAKDINKVKVANFFDLLTTVLTENDLLLKPVRIYNMDETCIQLNATPDKVLDENGTKKVESPKAITVLACSNAIGNFLPPVFIVKGVNQKSEFEEGLPLASKVYMQGKSSHLSEGLFYKWLTEHFIPHKLPGEVLLILDGKSSCANSSNILEAARDNDVILLCPNHTTSALRPLDRSVFVPLKKYYVAERNQFMSANHNKLNWHIAGQLIAKAWFQAASPVSAMNGFLESGIYPLNQNILCDADYAIPDIALDELAQECTPDPLGVQMPSLSVEFTVNESVLKSEIDEKEEEE